MPTIGDVLGQQYATIVAIGDSITAVNHWTHGGLNWVGLLQCNAYPCFSQGCTIINSGIGGDSLHQGLARLERDVLRFAPQLTIISFGMNDVFVPDNLSNFTADLREMVHRVQDIGSMVLLRTPNPMINMADGSELRTPDLEPYAAAIVEVAQQEDTWVVDHYSLWRASLDCLYHGEMVLIMGNPIHPNAHGHRRFYHELAPTFGMEALFQHDWAHILEKQGV